MSEDLKKMKVTIEGDAKSLKKELGSARAEVKKVTDVFKNAFKLDESQALRSVTIINNTIDKIPDTSFHVFIKNSSFILFFIIQQRSI